MYWNAEADEVDGLEETVDKWTEGATAAILKEFNSITKKNPAAGKEAGKENGNGVQVGKPDSKLAGLPPLLPRRVQFTWQKEGQYQEAASLLKKKATFLNEAGEYTPGKPFHAKILAAERVTPPGYDKQIIHMELDIKGSGIVYKPGDAFGVLPENDPGLVDGILERLGQAGSKSFTTSEQINGIETPCTVREALLRHCDLTSPPKKTFLRFLAEACRKEEERDSLLEIVSTSGKSKYKEEMLGGQPNLLDILEMYPSCKPPMEGLIEFLPALAPREYSVSSALEVHENEIHFAFSVVEFETSAGRKRRGVATTWLEGLAERVMGAGGVEERIPIYLKPSSSFRHPEDLSKPIILIGPGTGVSPFRGFLEARKIMVERDGEDGRNIGEAWLFKGCRSSKDNLYHQDFESLREELPKMVLETAFSREQERKVYVQHKMADNSETL